MFAVLAVVLPAALAMAGCSPAGDYHSIFPAVEDVPPPRADTPMDANQVQRATEDLITDRNRLSAEAGGTGQSAYAAGANKPAAAGSGAAPAGPANVTPVTDTETK